MEKKGYILALILLIFIAGLSKFISSKNDTFKVELEGNPTTGYTWNYSVSKEGIIKEVKNDYVQDKDSEGAAGVGGTYYYTFEGAKEGEVTLTFEYKRDWENEEPLEKKVYKLIVDKKLNIKEQ